MRWRVCSRQQAGDAKGVPLHVASQTQSSVGERQVSSARWLCAKGNYIGRRCLWPVKPDAAQAPSTNTLTHSQSKACWPLFVWGCVRACVCASFALEFMRTSSVCRQMYVNVGLLCTRERREKRVMFAVK